ncbi:MAG: hypothetical protein JSU72_08865 [Deltaproteobacteria bacterium]|nr:MAG: hypothetical protein JSU72_08865 [Deltaproteobacteria bacterium]
MGRAEYNRHSRIGDLGRESLISVLKVELINRVLEKLPDELRTGFVLVSPSMNHKCTE